MKRRLLLLLLLCAVVAIVLWQGAGFLLVANTDRPFDPVSFYPPQSSEPILPIPKSLPLDARKIALGRRLFFDTRLSGDNRLACASCHDLARGGADGRRRSLGALGQLADLNAPTVFNSGFNFRQFWDGRAATLEDQIDGPVQNTKEMASAWPAVLVRLAADDEYSRQFHAIYGGLDVDHVKNAIAEFERSLLTPGSRFDRYLEVQRDALKSDEKTGYGLFKSYGCIACHQGINVGGNLYQRLGVMVPYFTGEADSTPANRGREAVTGKAEDMHVFKVPSLRNVALTAPYFHDGSVPTLEQAVVIMGEYQLGVAIAPREVGQIVSFLHSLTGGHEEKLP